MAYITRETKTEDGDVIVSPIEEIEVSKPQPVAVPCVVGVNAGMTIPTGEYASVKIGVLLSVTVEPSDIEDAFEECSTWVSDKLGEMASDIHKQLED